MFVEPVSCLKVSQKQREAFGGFVCGKGDRKERTVESRRERKRCYSSPLCLLDIGSPASEL